jgi:hypothetical protein
MSHFRKLIAVALTFMVLGITVSLFGLPNSVPENSIGNAGQEQDDPEVELPRVNIRARETTAPREIRARLERLRQDIRRRNLNFNIGYTTASDRPLPRPNAAQEDRTRTRERMQRQNQEAQRIIESERIPSVEQIMRQRTQSSGQVTAQSTQGSCASRQVYLYQGSDLPPIRNQGQCGSCWAFAGAGMVDSSYRIRYNRLANLAEQELIDCAGGIGHGLVNACDGFFIESTMLHLQLERVARESRYPYVANDRGRCDDPRDTYRISAWGWAGFGWASVAQIKDALCRYGPVATTIEVTELFQDYESGVFQEKPRSQYGLIPSVNHAVVIVGWDDNQRAWRVRNSWGTGWGENGYAWVRYDNNAIGWDTVWAVARNN